MIDKIQHTGLNRNILDKFYTKQLVVLECMKNIEKYIKVTKDDIIIEPSAGNGAFIDYIKSYSQNYIFLDIAPESSDIIEQDFLNFDINTIKNKYKNIHVIGNPPFGRQSSLAIRFIKKCCEFATSISFILPKSFKKDSMTKYFTSYYHLIFEMDLPENSFMINDKEMDVPCIFQIWIYKKETREVKMKLKPVYYEFVKKKDNPDIAFRRVGVNAGKISQVIDDKNIQSHYFIKFTDIIIFEQYIQKLNMIKFNHNNTFGPKSISKQELIKEFNNILTNQNIHE